MPLCIASLTFHGEPPLLELGTLDEMQRPRPSIFTVHPLRRSAWVVRRTRAVRSRYRSFDDLTREQSWKPKRKKWPCSLTAPISTPPPRSEERRVGKEGRARGWRQEGTEEREL